MKNTMTKLLLSFTVAALAAALPVWAECPASAPDPISVTSGTHDSSPIQGAQNMVAQTFTAPSEGCVQLDSITVRVKKSNNTPDGDLFLRLYKTSGGLPDLSEPVGDAINLGTTDSATYVDKTANFNPKPQLQGRTLYAFVLSAPAASTGSKSYRAESRQQSPGSPYGGGVLYHGEEGSFAAQSNRDLVMTIAFSCCPPPATDCTYSQGYWKNHADAWPVDQLDLGTRTYTKAELLSILNHPAGGNGLVILAYQLIAAKLNIENGADPAALGTAVMDADGMVGNLVVPPVDDSTAFIHPSVTGALTQILDEYNNGVIGPGHCDQ